MQLTGQDATPRASACGPRGLQWQSECIHFSGNVSQCMFETLLRNVRYASGAASIYPDYGQPVTTLTQK
jgi:hypothetical protein